eukprot:TRINITY_DN7104_c0_g1_i13.p1 TRINITY_DN7104_c0_g1~~TRINITY_DN7104_c0_g1_i13.p1  ORF type:complete len:208 (-),score=17.33 TRINITY_DN7104_c0_g1_i13:157-780(-)
MTYNYNRRKFPYLLVRSKKSCSWEIKELAKRASYSDSTATPLIRTTMFRCVVRVRRRQGWTLCLRRCEWTARASTFRSGTLLGKSGSEVCRPRMCRMRRRCFLSMMCLVRVIEESVEKDSLEGVEAWIKEAMDVKQGEPKVFVVGNKTDLGDEKQVSSDEGKGLADKYEGEFFEVSALTGHNVTDLFVSVGKKLITMRDDSKKRSCR